MKDFRLVHGGVKRLAPGCWALVVMVSYSAGSGSRVGKGCKRTRVGDTAVHLDLGSKDLH